MRIIRLANFFHPRSGGLRTALQALGAGYLAAGHEAVLVVPGCTAADELTPSGRVITVPGPLVPWSGGYRVMLRRRPLADLLDGLAPDRIEVSDRFTLLWTAAWARQRGVPSVMVSHESLYGVLGVTGMPAGLRTRLADLHNARTARLFDTVVCTTVWAGQEFERIGATNVVRVPLGVDLEQFHPDRRDPAVRNRYESDVLIVHCGRLSPEKRPNRSVAALAALRDRGVDATLVIAGDGPMRERLERLAADLPVHFLDFMPDRHALATLLASADIVISPGPIETFGLAALEALACGTPVVVDGASAMPEVVGDGGVAVHGDGPAFADGVLALLSRAPDERRRAARQRAEAFDWRASTAGFLAVHGIDAHRMTV